jgi:hypothetical protein
MCITSIHLGNKKSSLMNHPTLVNILLFLIIVAQGCNPLDSIEPTGTIEKPVALTIEISPSSSITPSPLLSPTPSITEKIENQSAATSTKLVLQTRSTDTLVPTEISATLEPDIPGWILFVNYPGYPEYLDIIHTSGKGWRTVFKGENPNHLQSPFWRSDGQWIGFVGHPLNKAGDDIYIVRPDGSELTRLTYIEGYKRANSWSSDGKWIIYSQTVGEPRQAEVDLYEIEVETRFVRQITNTEGIYEHSPVYSPGGDEIVYSSIKEGPGQEFHLYIMNRNGSDVRQISEIPIFSGMISPDGKRIAYSSLDECEDIYIIDLSTSRIQKLTALPGSETHPSWSPDGEWLAFMGRDTCGNGVTGWEIYIVRKDGKGLKRLTHIHEENPVWPAWAPLPAIQLNKSYAITESGSDLKLRQGPSLQAEILDRLKEGEVIDVIEGPIEADEYLWWKVRVESDSQEGWVAENPGWFAPSE